MKILAIVMTFNEEAHIKRCIQSILPLTNEIIIIDSYSSDKTELICKNFPVKFVQHEWISHAEQFNWALSQIKGGNNWVIRIDADEYLTEDLTQEIRQNIKLLGEDVAGVTFPRRIVFGNRLLKYGGIGNIKTLRLFRYGRGKMEPRLMDEHIIVDGRIVNFRGAIIDENNHGIARWIEKHNTYSSNEAIEMMKYSEHNIRSLSKGEDFKLEKRAKIKRWIKKNIYSKMNLHIRTAGYFLYRYIFLLGFMDGKRGFEFHILQGYWYRLVVDIKIEEAMRSKKLEPSE